MLEASVLKIMPIGNFDIYYRAHMRGTTSLSIHIDGLTICTLDVPGHMKPASGKDTVGAFQNGDKRALVAWIDPVSGEYITSDRTVYDSLLTIPFPAILAIFATALLHQARFVAIPLLGASIIWAASRVVRGRKSNSALESLLRSQFQKGTS